MTSGRQWRRPRPWPWRYPPPLCLAWGYIPGRCWLGRGWRRSPSAEQTATDVHVHVSRARDGSSRRASAAMPQTGAVTAAAESGDGSREPTVLSGRVFAVLFCEDRESAAPKEVFDVPSHDPLPGT